MVTMPCRSSAEIVISAISLAIAAPSDIAIPTSAGTGSEVTPFAVITDESTNVKYPLADYELMPKMAIVDCNMMMNAPKGLTSASGIDAVTHALEAYASMMATEYTDGLAIEALKNIFPYIPIYSFIVFTNDECILHIDW